MSKESTKYLRWIRVSREICNTGPYVSRALACPLVAFLAGYHHQRFVVPELEEAKKKRELEFEEETNRLIDEYMEDNGGDTRGVW